VGRVLPGVPSARVSAAASASPSIVGQSPLRPVPQCHGLAWDGSKGVEWGFGGRPAIDVLTPREMPGRPAFPTRAADNRHSRVWQGLNG
jgi:hypothetical protein